MISFDDGPCYEPERLLPNAAHLGLSILPADPMTSPSSLSPGL